jgi:hypothetical protein
MTLAVDLWLIGGELLVVVAGAVLLLVVLGL